MRNDLAQFRNSLHRYLLTVPKMMGRLALEETKLNFRRGGYEADSGNVVPWEPRKAGKVHGRTRKDGGRDRRYRLPKGRALLVQSGRLRRSPRIVATTPTSVTIGTDVPYAQPLQEGNDRLPARPFLTASPSLKRKIIQRVAADITKLLNR